MRVDVPWSTRTTPVEVDSRRLAGVLSAKGMSAEDPDGILRAAIGATGGRI